MNADFRERKFILLVEDNPDDEELTRLAFAETCTEIELVVVRDGQGALDFLFAAGPYRDRNVFERPRLILLDLKLPKVDGLEVLRAIRADARTRFLPVVILTTSREEKDLLDCYNSGANSYIRKPVDYTRFVDVVRQLCAYWLALNEVPPASSK